MARKSRDNRRFAPAIVTFHGSIWAREIFSAWHARSFPTTESIVRERPLGALRRHCCGASISEPPRSPSPSQEDSRDPLVAIDPGALNTAGSESIQGQRGGRASHFNVLFVSSSGDREACLNCPCCRGIPRAGKGISPFICWPAFSMARSRFG